MITLPDNFQIARMLASKIFPYWRSLLWSLTPVEAPGLGTIGVDKYLRFYVDTEVVKKWTPNNAFVSLIHELIHITNRHHSRGNGIEDNIPADFAVNSWIDELLPLANEAFQRLQVATPLEAPTDWVHPKQFDLPVGLTLEEYKELWRNHPKNPGPMKIVFVMQGEGDGQDQGQSGDGKHEQKPGVGKGCCGSCAHKGPAPWEQPAPHNGGADGLSEAEVEVRLKQVAEAIRDSANKSIGRTPGCLNKWAEGELTPPTISWQQELASATCNAVSWAAGAVSQTWRKINRRSQHDILFPGLMNPIPSIAAVMDSSGSMGGAEFVKAQSEFVGVIQAVCHFPVPTLIVDADVQKTMRVLDPRKMPYVGGGGTDMTVGIKAALNLRPKPRVIIVFTDGFTPWQMEPPHGVRVIAVIVHPNGPKPPDWIKAIFTTPPEKRRSNDD